MGVGVAGVIASKVAPPRILAMTQDGKYFRISIDRRADLAVTIYDSKGVGVRHADTRDNQLTVPLQGLPQGNFLLKGEADHVQFSQKLLIAR